MGYATYNTLIKVLQMVLGLGLPHVRGAIFVLGVGFSVLGGGWWWFLRNLRK